MRSISGSGRLISTRSTLRRKITNSSSPGRRSNWAICSACWFANGSYAVLLIFQAMDAAGKDGAISHVLSGVHPQGCVVHDFKHPSAEELTHDFLWRTTRQLPARGMIGVFNRSYYEEVLVVREHHKRCWSAKNIPHEKGHDKAIWKGRQRSIVEFEQHLHRNGTRVVKIFLHLSKRGTAQTLPRTHRRARQELEVQRGRRVTERAFWDQYAKLYEDCLSATSTKAAPWHVVPADDKLNARLIIARVMSSTR